MSTNYVDKVLAIAKAEVGYLEKKSNKNLDSKTANAGSNNYTKYGRDMHKVYPSVMDFPAYWCDAFVDWCFYQSYGKANAKALLGGNFNDYTVASAQLYKNKGRLNTTAKKGDQVFFTRNGKVSGCHHTGIVYKVDKTYFYTYEGNTSGASGVVRNGGGVAKKKYKISSYKGKVLFGHPNYDTKPASATVQETVDKAKDAIKKIAGSTKINTIKMIQNNYINKIYGYKITVTGKYDSATKKALIKILQKELNEVYSCKLTVDGEFGSKTKSSVRVLKKGIKNDVVAVLQALLICNGCSGTSVDGDYGSGTAKAVKAFQKKKKLTADGEAGKNTFTKLCA